MRGSSRARAGRLAFATLLLASPFASGAAFVACANDSSSPPATAGDAAADGTADGGGTHDGAAHDAGGGDATGTDADDAATGDGAASDAGGDAEAGPAFATVEGNLYDYIETFGPGSGASVAVPPHGTMKICVDGTLLCTTSSSDGAFSLDDVATGVDLRLRITEAPADAGADGGGVDAASDAGASAYVPLVLPLSLNAATANIGGIGLFDAATLTTFAGQASTSYGANTAVFLIGAYGVIAPKSGVAFATTTSGATPFYFADNGTVSGTTTANTGLGGFFVGGVGADAGASTISVHATLTGSTCTLRFGWSPSAGDTVSGPLEAGTVTYALVSCSP